MSQVTRRNFLAQTMVAASAGTIASMILSNNALGAEAEAQPLPQRVVVNGRINQSACHWCFGKIPFERFAAIGAALGLKGLDLVGPKDFPILKKYNLVGTITPSHGIGKGFNRKENHAACVESVRKSIEATAEAGFPSVICFSGNTAGLDPQEGLKTCVEGLKQVIGVAEEKKVTICMELLNSKVNHKDYMCDNTAWGVALCKALGSDRFKLLFDIYHMAVQGEDVIAMIKEHSQYFGHYHTAGVPGRHEIDDSQTLKYPDIMKAIVETGYKGYVGQEFSAKHDAITSLAQAVKICDV